jgi:uncharacterized protein YecE (DUF72 family)
VHRLLIGTAGWSVPRSSIDRCPPPGTHLERYARHFSTVEINSSFYRPHAPSTYARWAASTPDGFRFAIKLPREITHDLALRRPRRPLERFLTEISGLGPKRGVVLIQLPPSLVFDSRLAGRFLEGIRQRDEGRLVCEPRHPSWFEARADGLLASFQVARVAADPERAAGAGVPGGWTGLTYYRLHGSPHIYWSSYGAAYLEALASRLHSAVAHGEAWAIFDNTARGAAIENAWELARLVDPQQPR